jgi:hypothetical protein
MYEGTRKDDLPRFSDRNDGLIWSLGLRGGLVSGACSRLVPVEEEVRIQSSVLLSDMPRSQPRPHVDRLIQE